MRYQFYIDPDTGVPHIYKHRVAEAEAIEVIETCPEVLERDDGSLVAQGPTGTGRLLQVVHREFAEDHLIFVITAYDLVGAAKRAFLRRLRTRK